jgi:hypothetical protein
LDHLIAADSNARFTQGKGPQQPGASCFAELVFSGFLVQSIEDVTDARSAVTNSCVWNGCVLDGASRSDAG